ncbi:MAG: ABC transporter permease [Planctomyces sp.]|nr:ABC transporter permease [Planctomyces sp.]
MILTILRILYLRLRNNPLELLLVFVMPVVFFSIFAGIFSKGIATGSDKKLRVGWITGTETTLGLELRAFLESNSTLECKSLIECPVPSNSSEHSSSGEELADGIPDDAKIDATIADAQRSGRYDLIIRLPLDFPSELAEEQGAEPCSVQLVTDGQNPMAVAMVTSVVEGFFAQKQASTAAMQLVNLSSATRYASKYAGPEIRDQGYGGPVVGEQTFEALPGESESQRALKAIQCFDPVSDPATFFGNEPGSEWLITDAEGVISVNGISGVPREWLPEEFLSDPPKSDQTTLELLEAIVKARTAEKSSSVTYEAVRISIENPQAATQENPRIAMYAAGIAVLFLLFSSTGNAAALLEESESGTLDRMLIGKAGLFHIIAGKWLGIFLLGCLQITVMFLWAELIFRIQLWKHLDGFTVMTVCTAAATASFAMLMATLCRSRAQLNAVSVVLILSMSAVGGSMIPRFVMSDRMKEIGQWTFNAWALDGYQKVFWYQSPITSLRTEVTVLLGSAVVLGVLALLFSRRWKRG